jgi:hypothetical protein
MAKSLFDSKVNEISVPARNNIFFKAIYPSVHKSYANVNKK